MMKPDALEKTDACWHSDKFLNAVRNGASIHAMRIDFEGRTRGKR